MLLSLFHTGGYGMNICVFGASSDRLDRDYYDAARRLGELIGRGGHTLVYGGGRTGLMGACAGGVIAAGGGLVGVAPHFFDEGDVLLKEQGAFVFTETMAERKSKMEQLADAFIVLPGGVGTLEEFFEVFTLRLLGRQSGNIVLLNTCGYYDALYALIADSIEKGFTARDALALLPLCDTPEAALAAALAADEGTARGVENWAK